MAAVCYGYDITHGENRGAVSMMDERWLSVDEIAEYLGVGRETIYNWIEKRAMPAHKVGRCWKFKRQEVDAWVESGKAAEGCSAL